MEKPKVVLITGASSGIGKATAIEMRGRGWRVFATVRRETDAVELTQVGRGLIEPLIMDVTDQASVERALAIIQERAGRLDALVNNAGIAVGGPVEMLTSEDLQQQFDVNVLGMHRVTRAALPMLREARGRIVNVSSVAGQEVFPFHGAYAASKHAVEALSDALRMELHGVVKVIVIQPSAVSTPMWETATDMEFTPSADYPAEEVERLARLYRRVGARGVEPGVAGKAIGNALELPWPLPYWIVSKQPPLAIHLMRLLPRFITDQLKLRTIGWPPKGRRTNDGRPTTDY
ncbi:MAG: SDR family oxidoreductase [Ardenticatenaceae bacterium]